MSDTPGTPDRMILPKVRMQIFPASMWASTVRMRINYGEGLRGVVTTPGFTVGSFWNAEDLQRRLIYILSSKLIRLRSKQAKAHSVRREAHMDALRAAITQLGGKV